MGDVTKYYVLVEMIFIPFYVNADNVRGDLRGGG